MKKKIKEGRRKNDRKEVCIFLPSTGTEVKEDIYLTSFVSTL